MGGPPRTAASFYSANMCITYGILRFRASYGEGGLSGLDPENKVTVNGLILNLVLRMVRMILVSMQNFKLLTFLTFRDLTSQKFPFQNGTSHRDSIFIPWNRAKLEKNHFL